MATIQITPEHLFSKANEVRSLVAEHDEAISKLNAIVRGLDEVWRGASQEEYSARFGKMSGVFTEFSESLNKFAVYMDTSANMLLDTDNRLAAEKSRLPDITVSAGRDLSKMSEKELDKLWKESLDEMQRIYLKIRNLKECLLRANFPEDVFKTEFESVVGKDGSALKPMNTEPPDPKKITEYMIDMVEEQEQKTLYYQKRLASLTG